MRTLSVGFLLFFFICLPVRTALDLAGEGPGSSFLHRQMQVMDVTARPLCVCHTISFENIRDACVYIISHILYSSSMHTRMKHIRVRVIYSFIPRRYRTSQGEATVCAPMGAGVHIR